MNGILFTDFAESVYDISENRKKAANKAMRIVFMGTPEFAVPSLQLLINTAMRSWLVVTQPDRPKGRKRTLTPPPVKEAALLWFACFAA